MFVHVEYRIKDKVWFQIIKLDVEGDEQIDKMVRSGLLNRKFAGLVCGPDAWCEYVPRESRQPSVHPRFVEDGDIVFDVYDQRGWLTPPVHGSMDVILYKAADGKMKVPNIEELSTILHRGRSWPSSDFPYFQEGWSWTEEETFAASCQSWTWGVEAGPHHFVSKTRFSANNLGDLWWAIDIRGGLVVPVFSSGEDFKTFLICGT